MDMALEDQVVKWAAEELALRNVPDVEDLRLLSRGNGAAVLRFLVERVRSRENIDHVRKNLQLHGMLSIGPGQEQVMQKLALRRRQRVAEEETAKIEAQLKALREQICSWESSRQRDSDRYSADAQRAVLQMAQTLRVNCASEKLDKIRADLRAEQDTASGQGPTELADVLRKCAVDQAELGCNTEIFGRFQDRAAEHVALRTKLLTGLRNQHVEVFLESQLEREQRQRTDAELHDLIGPGAENKSALMLRALLCGEQAALECSRNQLRSVRKRIRTLEEKLASSTCVIESLCAKEERARELLADSEKLRDEAVETFLRASQSFEALRLVVDETVHLALTRATASLEESREAAYEEEAVSSRLEVQRTSRASLGGQRTSLGSFSVSTISEANSSPGLEQLGLKVRSQDNVLREVVQKLVAREEALQQHHRTVMALDEMSENTDPTAESERCTRVLRGLRARKQETQDLLLDSMAKAKSTACDSIPRLAREAKSALNEWWEQPARRSAPWKQVNGASLEQTEQSFSRVCTSISTLES